MTEIRVQLPSTGFIEPAPEQLRSLSKIVAAAYPGWRVPDEDAFRRAFIAQGFFFRLPTPNTRLYYGSLLDAANEFLIGRLHWQAIDGGVFMFAIRAANDVPIRFANPGVGQLQEVGLDQYSGLPCRNHWAGLLDGSRNLLTPTPPPAALQRAAEPNPTRVYRQDRPAGPWQDVTGSDAPLWR
jgi:hypothetical protein